MEETTNTTAPVIEKTATLTDLTNGLMQLFDLLRSGQADIKTAKVINQTSNQVQNAMRMRLEVIKFIGSKDISLDKAMSLIGEKAETQTT